MLQPSEDGSEGYKWVHRPDLAHNRHRNICPDIGDQFLTSPTMGEIYRGGMQGPSERFRNKPFTTIQTSEDPI